MPSKGTISSVSNPAVMAAARLHHARHRRSEHRSLLEGPVLVAEAVRSGAGLSELFGVGVADEALAAEAGATFRAVTESVLRRLAGTETPRGPVAVLDIPAPVIAADRRLLVVWGVSDPGNCGTLLRTAAAFGCGFVAGPGSADPWSPKVLRSAAGGHFHTTVGEVATVAELGERELIGTIPTGGALVGLVGPKAAIIVGSEAHGLPAEVIASCDRLVSIQMPGGVESLNAAVAGAIVAYVGTHGGAGG